MTTATSNFDDQDLITAALRGETRAYGELVVRHRAGVVNVVYRMCGDEFLAEEAAQEAFLRAWQRLAGYRPEHSFRAWVYRIAINAALDVLRRDRRLTGLDGMEGEELVEETAGPEDALEERERADKVRQALLALSPASRAAIVLREYSEMSYMEIAATLGIPLGTVMSRLNSARAQLRKELVGALEVL
jgi:RNA polymerase sigma-70 factor, ECF subfamily